MPMATTPVVASVPERATTIARGLIRTRRATSTMNLEQGMLRLGCRNGGYYWVSLDGRRVLRGKAVFEADELQPKFGDAMGRAVGWQTGGPLRRMGRHRRTAIARKSVAQGTTAAVERFHTEFWFASDTAADLTRSIMILM